MFPDSQILLLAPAGPQLKFTGLNSLNINLSAVTEKISDLQQVTWTFASFPFISAKRGWLCRMLPWWQDLLVCESLSDVAHAMWGHLSIWHSQLYRAILRIRIQFKRLPKVEIDIPVKMLWCSWTLPRRELPRPLFRTYQVLLKPQSRWTCFVIF